MSEWAESDKATWHRYIEFYEPRFNELCNPSAILEYGVFKGGSIRYLLDRFPSAEIAGVDILDTQPEWPTDPRATYAVLDQGDSSAIAQFLEGRSFDLVIEDGSHIPQHQRNCLVATLPHIRAGGMYILEDLHTSHPAHPTMRRRDRATTNCYHVLLAIEHLRRTGQPLSDRLVSQLATRSLFSSDDVRAVHEQLASVEIYRRAGLPHQCWKCQTDDFDITTLTCRCGEPLMQEADSICAVLGVRN